RLKRGGGGGQAGTKSPPEPRIGRGDPAHHPPIRSRSAKSGAAGSAGRRIGASWGGGWRKGAGFCVGRLLQVGFTPTNTIGVSCAGHRSGRIGAEQYPQWRPRPLAENR